MPNPRHLVRLYINIDKKLYWRVKFSNAKKTIEVPLLMNTVEQSRRGFPWECWLATEIEQFAKLHPEAFPHKVLHVYVIRAVIYIIDKYSNGQPSHAIRYLHDFGPLVRQFDKLSKQDFIDSVGGDLTLKMRPAKKGGHAERIAGRKHGPTGDRKRALSNGALRRAKEAGLVPASL